MDGPRDVPGTDYRVRAMSAGDMMQLEQSGVDGVAGLVRLAYYCTITTDGEHAWPDEEAAQRAPWPVVKACADEALIVNGLTGEDLPGN